MSKKLFAGALAIAFALSLVTMPKAHGATTEELMALILQLQAQLAAQQGTSGGFQFTRNLTLGSTGNDVKELQKFLNSRGFQVAATGAGSVGNESTYFGAKTQVAVSKFQVANGISPTAGYFGPATRAKVNSMSGGTSGNGGPTPTSSFLKVEATGPVMGSVPTGSIYNPVLMVKLSAGNQPVTVSSLTVMRGGFIANTNVTGISVWDDMGNRYGNILTSLTSDGQATFSFGNSPITVAAGMTKTITVAANLASGSYSGTINFSLPNASSVMVTSGGPVTGTFPVVGPTLNVVDGSTSLGDARVDDRATIGVSSSTALTSGYDGNVEVGYTNREIYKFNVVQNNSKEAVKLERAVLYVGGNIQEDRDLTNFKLLSPEGNVIATAARAYDRYVTFNLATPYMIDKGISRDFTVQADIMNGSGNYFYMTFQNDYDLVLRGMTTGAGILPTDSSGSQLTADDVTNYSSGYNKIKTGNLTLSRATSSPSGTIAPASQNIVLGTFDLRAGGENLEVRKMGVQVKYAGLPLTGTLMVKDANTGVTYLSISADTTGIVTSTTPTAQTLLNFQQNLSTYLNLNAGQTATLQVIGTISQNATSSSNYTVYMGEFYAKRLSSNDYVNIAETAVQANNLTVKSLDLTIAKDASMGNVTRSAGASNAKVGQFTIQAVGDDIRVNTISLNIATSSNLQNVKLMEGSTQLGNTIGTPSSSGNSFSVSNYVIAKDSTKTISVYADILSNASTNSVVTIPASGISGVGVNSSVSLSSVPASPVTLQTISIGTPSVTIMKDGSAPSSKIVLAGQNGVELNKINFQATNEALTLRKITLALASASSSQWSTSTLASNFSTVYLYDGATLVGSGSVNSTNGTVSLTGLNVTLPQDTEKVLTVKADITDSATMAARSVGAVSVFSTSTDYMEIYASTGQLSTGVTLTSSATGNYFLFHAAAPVIANAMSNGVKTPSTNQEISKFTITNSAPAGGRTLTVDELHIVATMSGGVASSTVTTFKLYDDNGTEIASSTTSLTGGSPSATLDFTSSSLNWVTQTIGAGTSRTYTLKADTTNIRTGVSSGSTVYVSTKIDGSKGYLSSDTSGADELFWNDGGVTYRYTAGPANATTYAGNNASDSYPVDGATLQY